MRSGSGDSSYNGLLDGHIQREPSFPSQLDSTISIFLKDLPIYLLFSTLFYSPLYLTLYFTFRSLTEKGGEVPGGIVLLLLSLSAVLFHLYSQWGRASIVARVKTTLQHDSMPAGTIMKNSSKEAPHYIILSSFRLLLLLITAPLFLLPGLVVLVACASSHPLLSLRGGGLASAVRRSIGIARERWLNILSFHIFCISIFGVLLVNSLVMKEGLAFLLDLWGAGGISFPVEGIVLPFSVILTLLLLEPLKIIFYTINAAGVPDYEG